MTSISQRIWATSSKTWSANGNGTMGNWRKWMRACSISRSNLKWDFFLIHQNWRMNWGKWRIRFLNKLQRHLNSNFFNLFKFFEIKFDCPKNLSNFQQAQDILNNYYDNLQKLSDRQDQLNEKLEFFKMPQVFRPELAKIKKQLDLLQEVWDLVGEWEGLWDSYASIQILKINNENLENEVTQLSKKVNKSFELYKEKNWEILGATKDLMDNLKRTLPLIQDLCNPMLVERHWDAIKHLARRLVFWNFL